MGIDVKQELAVVEQMQQDKSTTDNVWEDIRLNMLPDHASFTGEESEGTTNRVPVIDSTAEQAGVLTASGLQNALTNPATRWFEATGVVSGRETTDEEKAWFNEATTTALAMFDNASSGFIQAQTQKYEASVFFGMGCVFMEESPLLGVTFQYVPLRQILVNENHEGRIDDLRRVFELTAAQASSQFVGFNPGNKIVAANGDEKKRNSEKFKFLHIVRPRRKPQGDIGSRSMAFESIYINMSEKHLVTERGFPEWPFSIPRWSKRDGEKYGRGLGGKALPDVKMGHRLGAVIVESVEKKMDPPLQLPDDGVQGPVSLLRGGTNFVRADLFRHGDAIRPIQTGANTNVGHTEQDRLDQRIERGFLNHLLTLTDDPRMSATQAVILDEKSLNALGPVIGRFEAEDLDPMVNRVIGIGVRQGRISEPPESLDFEQIKITYTSPLAKKRRSSELNAIVSTFTIVEQMAAVKPEVRDNYDYDAASRMIGEIQGVPQGILVATADRDKLRKEREVAMANQQSLDDAAQLASAAGAAAPALKVIEGGQQVAS